jgi:FkbM family methyltransferase
VVGIEANPLAIPALETRFAAELREGRFVLLPLGIASAEGEALFWVCDDQPKWSSFDRSIASRNGARHHSVTVRTGRLGPVLEQFGVANYCKIDIEGNDDLCLEDLTPATRPAFISVELNEGDRQLARLSQLGYSKFKIISQRTFCQAGSRADILRARLPYVARRLARAAEARLASHSPDPTWRFPRGSSGPFGEDTHGDWRTLGQALEIWERLAGRAADLSEWHDIHAH